MAEYAVQLARGQEVLEEVLAWSKGQGYRGYNKHDGLNSPLLRTLLGWGGWPRILAIQAVMRSPINLRPLLLVSKTDNPKGLALFVRALLDHYRLTGEADSLQEAEQLLRHLIEIRSPGPYAGPCWGYHYIWQDPGFCAPANTPNAVVTSFVCQAFLDAYRVTAKQQYLNIVGRIIPFFLNDLQVLKDVDGELCLSYMPLPMTMRVMDVSILVGDVIATYGRLSGRREWQEQAQRLVRYVVNRQTNEGAWFYTDPPRASRIRHDNYHTGFILDALHNYMLSTEDYQWQKQYSAGLEFYARTLFNENGSPRWMSDTDYPHDIHGAAQGIITFSRHRDIYPKLANKIAAWGIEKMYTPGRFYYQETQWLVKRFTLMRWCNAWMARALALLTLNSAVSKDTKQYTISDQPQLQTKQQTLPSLYLPKLTSAS